MLGRDGARVGQELPRPPAAPAEPSIEWARDAGVTTPSLSWALAEHLIKNARIGCVPGVDFGPGSEGYLRFCFGRERNELTGALASMKTALAQEVGR